MTTIALIGAGGKMGFRLASNLKGSEFEVRHVEVSEAGRARLQSELGITCVDAADAVPGADAVILAVPDNLVGKISASLSPMMASGTMVITLDAAAPFAGHLPDRSDLTYFVTHPCHPPIFNDETTMEAKTDYFGGSKAKQHIVSALMQGPDESFDLGERIGRTIYAPVVRSHRCTVDQMALLEPGLSETICATLLVIMREAMDEVVNRGVPHECARDFLLGHMNILAAVIFDEQPGVFSDACNKAIENARGQLMKDDWKRVFEREEIAESIRRIT
ncbi:NAD(P)-binding domain-containing protein [Pseudomonas lalucatii]|uniref:NAD(P)-binding domain-containing protein n=1 Tax=Pseudomonas lalucatii TaxID=1424203 RepID=A0ABS5Q756_9PSED|nr:phosphogluconate dehydrogenase C-terminal domain-containing protein [Pseudomonas lalucatii]MBS7664449.1 NAD(P)-binding domain-containing protein [Pseudomonas lalucatii]MBS7725630.1 NAD(P)-binding domain-containing protein [Pseudomonas lalucatii]QVM88751.1 NAD(P)-binding domain-containing protein [Pseudomonas lalucatii]